MGVITIRCCAQMICADACPYKSENYRLYTAAKMIFIAFIDLTDIIKKPTGELVRFFVVLPIFGVGFEAQPELSLIHI